MLEGIQKKMLPITWCSSFLQFIKGNHFMLQSFSLCDLGKHTTITVWNVCEVCSEKRSSSLEKMQCCDMGSNCTCSLFFVVIRIEICQNRRTRRSVELMRKRRKPSQEDPAAVGPSQEQECEPGKGNPSPSAIVAVDHYKGYSGVGLSLFPK